MKIRNGGWTFAPQAMLVDHGTFYLIDLRVFTRRIHKSSIDKEYEVNVILGLAWANSAKQDNKSMVIRTSKPEWQKAIKDIQDEEVRKLSSYDSLQNQHEKLLNSIRSSHGLKSIRNSKKLSEISYLYGAEMAKAGTLSHVGPDGSNFSTRVLRGGYNGFPRAENLAWNYASLETVVAGWMTSPGHRENILISDVTEVGIGHFTCPKHEHWWVQLFGS